MTTSLAPNLFDRRFPDFVEIGRARLRPLAPEWTDHNAHDPGITLMELLAWVAEAQLYAVGHLRRDERAAFASLMGLAPRGTRGARGLIWPDRGDANAPGATFARNIVIGEDAAVHVAGDQQLTFRPERTILWTPGRIVRLEARSAGGTRTDLTSINERGATPFLPFGESAGRGSVLALGFSCRDEDGLFGRDPRAARAARWTIGILSAPSSPGAPNAAAVAGAEPGDHNGRRSPLAATLVADDERFPVEIVSDSSRGMLASGAIMLDLSGVPSSPRDFTIELAAPRGLPRPPRVLRIEPNVVPVHQGRAVHRELKVPTGLPDWSFALDLPGLRFESAVEPVSVEVSEETGVKTWTRVRSFADSGPDDRVYEVDANAGRVTFGNGINGRIPPSFSQVLVSYAVSDAEAGNLGRNRTWTLAGFGGTFGSNPEPIAGGAAPSGSIDQRREARRRSRDEHALVSPADIAGAASAIELLEVARAWVAEPSPTAPRTGETTLIAMRRRPGGDEPERAPETPRWLESIRRRLAPRMPLGSRLVVRAPRYVEVIVRASVEAEQARNPAAVEADVRDALRRRLAVVELADGTEPRDSGDPVTRRDVAAWIRRIDGVRRIVSLELHRGNGQKVERIDMPPDGLPRWSPAASTLTVTRPAAGAAR